MEGTLTSGLTVSLEAEGDLALVFSWQQVCHSPHSALIMEVLLLSRPLCGFELDPYLMG